MYYGHSVPALICVGVGFLALSLDALGDEPWSLEVGPDTWGIAPFLVHCQVKGESQDKPGLNCAWQFGDGDQGWGWDQSHVYDRPGTYDVQVSVQGDPALEWTRTFSVDVRDAVYYTNREEDGTWTIKGIEWYDPLLGFCTEPVPVTRIAGAAQFQVVGRRFFWQETSASGLQYIRCYTLGEASEDKIILGDTAEGQFGISDFHVDGDWLYVSTVSHREGRMLVAGGEIRRYPLGADGSVNKSESETLFSPDPNLLFACSVVGLQVADTVDTTGSGSADKHVFWIDQADRRIHSRRVGASGSGDDPLVAIPWDSTPSPTALCVANETISDCPHITQTLTIYWANEDGSVYSCPFSSPGSVRTLLEKGEAPSVACLAAVSYYNPVKCAAYLRIYSSRRLADGGGGFVDGIYEFSVTNDTRVVWLGSDKATRPVWFQFVR